MAMQIHILLFTAITTTLSLYMQLLLCRQNYKKTNEDERQNTSILLELLTQITQW